MKTILVGINAKYIHSSLALRSIKAYNQEKKIEIAEYTINENIRAIFGDLYEKKADVYGFSCYIWNREETIEVATLLKKANPEAIIFFGGPEAWGDARGLLKAHPAIDFIVDGEGEETVSKCLSSLEKSGSFDEIPGIFYRNKKEGIIHNPTDRLLELDLLPFPYCEEDFLELKDRIIYYESSRGCPFGCSCCMSSVEKSVRFRSIQKVKEELRIFIDHQVPIVKFVDRTFNCNETRTLELFKFLIENRKNTLFHFEISADLLSDRIMELLKKVPKGLFQFEIGIQSTSEKTLQAVNRKNDLNRCLENIRTLAQMGNIHVHVDLIAGLPGEDLETFQKSFNETFLLHADMLQLGFLKVLNGSPIQDDEEKYGLVYSNRTPYEIVKSDAMSADDLLELKKVENAVEVYYNSGRFRESIREAEKFFKTPYELFLKLGEGMGRYQLSHAALCENIWQSCERKVSLNLALAIDFLLENKGKTLPDYLDYRNPANWKQLVRGFMEEKYPETLKEALKWIRVEKLGDHVILFNYQNKTWKDVTKGFQKVEE